MPARTFNDDLATDLERTFSNPAEFGSRWKYLPKDGGEQVISLTVVRQTTFTQETDAGLMRVYEIAVLVSKNATTGIPIPRVGDKLQSRESATPAPLIYAWTGEVEKEDAVGRTLIFRHTVKHHTGTEQRESPQ